MSNSAKYNVGDDVIRNELQQFGLPKEHCDSIAKSFGGAKDVLQEHFTEQTFVLPKLVSIDWKVNYILRNDKGEVNSPSVQLNIGYSDDNKEEKRAFELDQDKFNVLLGGL